MGSFSDEDINLAKKVNEKYGVPVSVTLGQYALESGYGEHTVGKNNYFNIKGDGTGGYRDYNSKEESFMDYGKLLTNQRYTDYTAGAMTVEEYITGVKNAGYAEDENYISKVMSIINSNNLTAYDNGNYSNSTTTKSFLNKTGVKWWGDIVIVVFSILLIACGVLFIVLAFMETDVGKVVKNPLSEVVKNGDN